MANIFRILSMFFLVGAVMTSHAATITVDTIEDVLDNSNGDCSLREAITAANNEAPEDSCASGSGADVIEFAAGVTGTITLAAELPAINSNIITDLSIVGPGRDELAISGEDTWRVLAINGGNVTIQGMSITNGYVENASGGGINISHNDATINLKECRVANNNAVSINQNGGGIFNLHTLNIEDCLIENNSAGGNGGGISNIGYGVYTPQLTIIDSIIRGNSATTGGGINNNEFGNVTIVRSEISDNHAGISGGGGITSTGTMLIQDSLIEGNHSDSWPAAIKAWIGELTIENSLIQRNYSPFGAAVRVEGTISISNTTISENYATEIVDQGDGLHVGGEVSLTNSTISGNTGNGVQISAGTPVPLPKLILTSSTITGNGGHGIRAYNNITMINSIVANNGGMDCDIYDANWMTNLGSNIDSDNSCWLTLATDQPGIDPLLGPLQDNGGTGAGVTSDQLIVPTHALLDQSPAMDAGDNSDCPAADQRDITRPQDGDIDGTATCDIGAYEYLPQPDIVISDDVDPGDDRSIPFGNLVIGSSHEAAFTLVNKGVLDLEVYNIFISNPVFTLNLSGGANPCVINLSIIIAPGENCTFSIVFMPDAAGSHRGEMTIDSDDPDEPEVIVNLSGAGINPNIEADVDALDFEQIAVNGNVSRIVSLNNTGSGPLTISAIDMSGVDVINFAVAFDGGAVPCGAVPITINEGERCTLAVSYAPQSAGTHVAQIAITSNDVDEGTLNIPLTGKAIVPAKGSDNRGGGGGGGGSVNPLDVMLLIILWFAGGRMTRKSRFYLYKV